MSSPATCRLERGSGLEVTALPYSITSHYAYSIYEVVRLIPNPIDQNPWAHWRSPMDMMRQG